MSLFLKNGIFIDWETLQFESCNIRVTEGINGTIEKTQKSPESTDQVIDCKGKYITKSLACGHHHIYSALARGMKVPIKPSSNFYEILNNLWWLLDKSLDKDIIRASALATAIQCAKNGVTFIIDHHASPNAIPGSLETIAEAIEEVGLSHLLCYEITDRDGMEKAAQGLEESENYLKNRQGLVGLHASFTVSEKTLKSSVDLASKLNSGIHIHVAEDLYDQKHCIDNYGVRVVERLHKAGALSLSRSILGHCIHLEQKERELLSDSPVWIAQNTESNLNNNVGYFNGNGLSERIMFGTDGMHSDMIKSAQAAFFVGQGTEKPSMDLSYSRLRNTHRYLSSNEFKGDGANNLTIFDYKSPTSFEKDNFMGHFFFGFSSSMITEVISNGKLVVKDRRLTTVDETEVLEFTRAQGEKLWQTMTKKLNG